ncbi:MAG: ankyrin repeat domain-containing protein [Terracidiphilus sp.]
MPMQTENEIVRRSVWIAGSRFRSGKLSLCLFLALSASASSNAGEIHKAVTKGDLNRVVVLLQAHPELLDSKDSLKRTPLQVAVAHNRVEIAELLLANGADVNARDPKQHTPLILALSVYNHDKMVRLLLAKGADVNLSDEGKMTALAYAVQQGQIDDAKILIANDANINFASGLTPLYFAIVGNRRNMVELLLANGADPNARGSSLLRYSSDPKIEALLKKYGAH